MLLENATWPEVENYLKNKPSIIVPLGSTEQHGPTGLIGTDFINAFALAEAVGANTATLVTPPLAVGMAQHHMAFPGSLTLRPQTYMAVLVDWIVSLARHGFKRIYFINGHGGNIAPTLTAFNEFYAKVSLDGKADWADVLCRLVNWWMLPRTAVFIDDLFGDADGTHATASEIAMTHYLRPKTIKPLPPGLMKAKAGSPSHDIHNSVDYRNRFSDGRIGSDVSTATTEKGEKIFKICVEELTVNLGTFQDSGLTT